MKYKKWLASLAAVLFAKAAQGIIWIIAGIVVLVVGGVVIIGLHEMTLRINEPGVPAQTPGIPDNVLRVYEMDPVTLVNFYWMFDSLAMAGAMSMQQPLPPPEPAAPAALSSIQSTGFPITYGMESNLWVGTGTNTGNFYGGRVGATTGNATNYSFDMYSAGQVVHFVYHASDTNNGANGFTTTVLDNDPTNYPVTILRSTNLVDWESVHDDFYFMRHSLKSWTDPAPPWPRAFYKIEYNTNLPPE